MNATIKTATPSDAPTIALLAMALTDEIIDRTGARHFNVNIASTTELCKSLMIQKKYTVFLAVDEDTSLTIGFAALCESHALYAEGTFGIIQEFYIQPPYRSKKIGALLLLAATEHAQQLGWKRLELCTPPLPEFERTVDFYHQNGFEITGGHKMKYVI